MKQKLWFPMLIVMAVVVFSLIGGPLGRTGRTEDALATKPVLILYDSPSNSPSAKLGYTFGIMLSNLLGHFELEADIRPVSSYSPGQIERYRSIFYLGSHYDHPLPVSFLTDMERTEKTVTWFKYNLWQMARLGEQKFSDRAGFGISDVEGLNAKPTFARPEPGFFDIVSYKGKTMKKHYSFDAESGQVSADPDVGVARIQAPDRVKVHSTIQNSVTGEEIPYVLQGGAKGNFWYFADLPFTYIGPRDRYLVICDLLHDILKIDHPENHRAMVRLEDVGAKVDFESMKRLSDFLYSRKIPFSVAAFPSYRNPLGAGTGGRSEFIRFSQASSLQRSLQYAQRRGGALVMHGYTHQYGKQKNPHTGVSADDFEFWDIVGNRPVREDSESWVLARLDAGLEEFRELGYFPYAWEAPHYQASPVSYRAFTRRFRTTYQRVVYYSSERPNLDPQAADRDYSAGMFFPYVIAKDFYGQRVLPENLGNIEYDISDIDPTSYFDYTWEDLLTNAEYALVVRDGFASFFFHPFWIEPGFEELDAFEDFTRLVDGISRLGFRWVGGDQVRSQR